MVTELEPIRNFFPAEEYHQKYLDKNPGGYCHIPSSYFSMKGTHKETPEELRARISDLAYEVTQNPATCSMMALRNPAVCGIASILQTCGLSPVMRWTNRDTASTKKV